MDLPTKWISEVYCNEIFSVLNDSLGELGRGEDGGGGGSHLFHSPFSPWISP